jgi:uncharacterized membrane protein YjjB (DUF3815 family)
VLAVGCLAIVGNEIRLALFDAGMALAPATLFGALAGLLGSVISPPARAAHALTVPGIIIMIPGTYAFQTIVMFNQGDIQAPCMPRCSTASSSAPWPWASRRLALHHRAASG